MPKLELRIVFETSAILTDSELEVVSRATRDIIDRHNKTDLVLSWHLPDVVASERAHQMVTKAVGHFGNTKRLELLMGRELGLTREDVDRRVRSRIAEQLAELQIAVLPLDYGAVDWRQIVTNALQRKPPFEASNEKGFRDACILETFAQFVSSPPTPSARRRIVLVTGDGLLQQAATARFRSLEHVQVRADLPALDEYINTLSSTVSAEFIEEMRPKAAVFFADKDTGLFHRAHLRERLEVEFGGELASCAPNLSSRVNDEWRMLDPRFEKKERTRTYWTTRIEIPAHATAALGLFDDAATNLGLSPIQLAMSEPVRRAQRTTSGTTTFAVEWSAIISTAGRFSRGRVDSLSNEGTKWRQSLLTGLLGSLGYD